jgi:hypothetical protein
MIHLTANTFKFLWVWHFPSIGGMFYAVTVIVVMGVAKPEWLRLPARPTSSASSLGRRKSDSAYSSLDKKIVVASDGEMEPFTLGTGPSGF